MVVTFFVVDKRSGIQIPLALGHDLYFKKKKCGSVTEIVYEYEEFLKEKFLYIPKTFSVYIPCGTIHFHLWYDILPHLGYDVFAI